MGNFIERVPNWEEGPTLQAFGNRTLRKARRVGHPPISHYWLRLTDRMNSRSRRTVGRVPHISPLLRDMG